MNKVTLATRLQQQFQLPHFRPGQEEIINAVLEGKDVLAVLPTGGGKSLCFQFPAVHLQKLVIVISPLIALMKDQVAGLHARGLNAGTLHSGCSDHERRKVFADIAQGGSYVLYLSPERAQKEGFHQWIVTRSIAAFAIDEAHCVSQWGHDFREEYAELKVLKKLRPDVPILALTASATPTVLDDIVDNLKLVKPVRIVRGFYRPNLYYQVEACADDTVKLGFVLQALRQNPTGRILIYCGTRRSTEELSKVLKKHFDKVGYYHAGLSNEDRNSVQNEYMGNGIRILTATNAFGMGIDQPDVRLVVHYQMPANIDSLYQEMGRAGRDSLPSTCLLLYSKKDKGLQSFFIQSSTAPAAIKSSRWRNLDALVSYAEGSECRHSEILVYFKDVQRIHKCGHCDYCDPGSDRRILSSAQPLQVLQQTVRRTLKKTKSKLSKFSDSLSPLDDLQEQRFQSLKSWRYMKAKELDVPAFVIFSDATLKAIAKRNPQKKEDLLTISGIGEAKLERFGWDVLAEIGVK